jgi:hypothetical protein
MKSSLEGQLPLGYAYSIKASIVTMLLGFYRGFGR